MNKWYIGQRVHDERHGDGFIIDIVLDHDYPIKVRFKCVYETYTIEGKEYNRDDDISLFAIKKGTPEARRIVAMLAREYRHESKIDNKEFDYGYNCALRNAYTKAKAMLGE